MTAVKTDRFPRQIRYIVGNEACERFSFYGMRSILVVFMVGQLLMEKSESTAVYHYFVSACYLFPLLGAWIADRFWGKYKTILILSLGYCLGHGILAMFDSKAGLYAGLFFIALGSGGIKPCVSAFVGDQFTSKNKHLVKSVFNVFYWAINFGSFFSTMMIPWVLDRFGPSWAFGIPGVLMAIALFIFWLGRAQYVNAPPTRTTGSVGFIPIFWYALINWNRQGNGFWAPARKKFKVADVEAAGAAGAIFKLFATVSIFWALFDQHGSSWVLQAQQMDLNVLGVQFKASQIAALNPLMVMGLIPIFAYGIYPGIEKLFGIIMTPLRRMSVGMVLTALSFVAAGLVEVALDGGIKVNVSWQFIQYVLITVSEVMISITGLEFAYTQAPRSMKSTIMSFWLLTVFVGNMITAWIAAINIFKGAMFFFFFAGLMAAVSVIFIWSAARYKPREYFEEQPALDPAYEEN
ncbi:MAG: POT family MFS transporter [Elusimicrobiota bacterium]